MPSPRDRHLEDKVQLLMPPVGRRVQIRPHRDDVAPSLLFRSVIRDGRSQQLLEKAGARIAPPVVGMEPFLDDDPLAVEEEDPRVGDAPLVIRHRPSELGMVLLQILVEHVQLADHPASRVRQQGIGDAVLGRERGEGFDGIVTDREQRNASRVKILGDPLQLHELRFAERSPPSAAVEYHHRGAAGPRLVEIDWFTRLVRQADVGEPRANGRTDVCVVARTRGGHGVTLLAVCVRRARKTSPGRGGSGG